MKKLILVTLMAFAASWLLAEARRESLIPATPTPLVGETQPILVYTPDRSDASGSTSTTSWRKVGEAQPQPKPTPAPSPKKAPPSWFPTTELEEQSMAKADSFGSRVIVGRVSSSEDRARLDLRQSIDQAVTDWLAADVATSWKVPENVLRSMVQGSYTQEFTRNLIAPSVDSSKSEIPGVDGLYTLYRAGQKLDFSPSRKARIIGMYRHDLATRRMQRLGGGLALALVTLAVLSGYIKADEATKGYYTNRLRLVSAVGLGAAGVVAYRLLV